jgi:hypothetical protein
MMIRSWSVSLYRNLPYRWSFVDHKKSIRSTSGPSFLFSGHPRMCSAAASSDAPPPGVLHHEWVYSDEHDVPENNKVVFVFLHRLFGQGKDLKSLAQELCERYRAAGLLIDLPGHGSSMAAVVTKDARPVTVVDCATAVGATLRHAVCAPVAASIGLPTPGSRLAVG